MYCVMLAYLEERCPEDFPYIGKVYTEQEFFALDNAEAEKLFDARALCTLDGRLQAMVDSLALEVIGRGSGSNFEWRDLDWTVASEDEANRIVAALSPLLSAAFPEPESYTLTVHAIDREDYLCAIYNVCTFLMTYDDGRARVQEMIDYFLATKKLTRNEFDGIVSSVGTISERTIPYGKEKRKSV